MTITIATIVAVLGVHAHQEQTSGGGLSALANPRYERVDQVLLIVTVVLVALAAANAVFITWATVLETRHAAALVRALGATRDQVSSGQAAAMLMPGLAGAIIGVPAGFALVAATSHGGGISVPPVWSLVAAVLGSLAVLAALAAVPARAAVRRMPAEVLAAERP
jgi:ABC-type antimicrobial peptide transport system permease subunit